MKLRIPQFLGTTEHGKHLELHKDAITQGFAILAKRGKGKTNLAGDVEEIFSTRGQSFVVLDPPDAHWGIRFIADRQGQPAGPSEFNVLLVGGDHGDIPLNPRAGKELAATIVEGDISAVISMRALVYTERQRFCADFAEELFRLNRTPRHLFFEEAQNFLPQKPVFEEQKRVLHAMQRLIGEGRGLGLGFTLISQRPALVNKDALSEVDNMLCLGMISPQDIDQMEGWFEHHFSDKAKLKELLDGLPRMKPGECWLLSPEWLATMIKFQARFRVTYHAGRTPKPGERAVNVAKFSVNEAVKKLKERFASKQGELKQEAETLKEAQKEIRSLKTKLRSQPVGKSVQVKVTDPRAIDQAVKKASLTWDKQFTQLQRSISSYLTAFMAIRDTVSKVLQIKVPTKREIAEQQKQVPVSPTPKFSPPAKFAEDRQPTWTPAQSDGNLKLRDGAERMLAAVAQWFPEGMTVGQMRAHAGLKKSGTFSAYMSDLRKHGLIEERNGLVFSTQLGLDYCKHIPAAPQSTEEVLAIWEPKLRDGARRMLRVLVEVGGQSLTKEELGERAELQKSGTFSAYLSDLKTARLAIVTRDGVAANSETLFL